MFALAPHGLTSFLDTQTVSIYPVLQYAIGMAKGFVALYGGGLELDCGFSISRSEFQKSSGYYAEPGTKISSDEEVLLKETFYRIAYLDMSLDCRKILL